MSGASLRSGRSGGQRPSTAHSGWMLVESPGRAGAARAAERGTTWMLRGAMIGLASLAVLLIGLGALSPSFQSASRPGTKAASVVRGGARQAPADRKPERSLSVVPELLRRANSIARTEGVGDSIESPTPARGYVSSRFLSERFHPVLKRSRPHHGMDIAAPWGAPILVPASGQVIAVRSEPGYGNVVVIDNGGGVETLFAHCSLVLVREGQHVQRNDVIALVGDTGLTTGPHLHYEVRVGGLRIDPLDHRWD